MILSIILAQATNAPPASVPGMGGSNTSLLLAIIPLIVPIVVELVKRGISILPSWSLPIIASGLGELINWVSGLLGGPTTTAINGVMLGAAGVGLREIADQVKSRSSNGKPIAVAKTIILAFGLISLPVIPLAITGCNTTQQTIAYQTIYSLESTTDAAMKSYFDLVIAGQVATNSVPQVSADYNLFQLSIRSAIALAHGNTNAPAPSDSIARSAKLINDINLLKSPK